MALLESLFGDDAKIILERDFQLLLLANTTGPLGTALLSPILGSLIGPLETSPANIGLLISVFSAPAIVITPIAGILTDRYGRKPVLVVALFIFGIAGSAIAFTTDFRIALGLRVLQGVGFAGIVPTIVTTIGDIYVGSEEATAQGIRFTTSGFTQMVFPLMAGGLVVIAWQYPFLLYALAIPIAVVVYVWLNEPSSVGSAGTALTDGGSTRGKLRALYSLVTQQRVFSIVIARGLPTTIWVGFLTYNSIVVVQIMGGTPAQAGLLTAIGSLAYALAGSQAGRATATFDSRLYLLISANICLGVGFVVFLFAPSLIIAGLGTSITGVGFGLTLSLYRSIITNFASDALRGGLVSLSEGFGRVTVTVTPLIMGAVIAIATPHIGIESSVQVAGLGTAVIGSTSGVVCLLVASTAPSIDHAE